MMGNAIGGTNYADIDQYRQAEGTRGRSGNDFTPIQPPQPPQPTYHPRHAVATHPDFRTPRQTEAAYLQPIKYRNNNFKLSDYVGSGAVRSLLFAGVMVAIVCGVLASQGVFKGIDSN